MGDSILQAMLSPIITGLNHDLRLPWGYAPSFTLRPASQAGNAQDLASRNAY